MLGLIWIGVVGLVVGALAKLIMPGKDPSPWWVTMLLGIAGAIVAGIIGRGLGWYHEGEPAGFIAAVLGAVLILWIYRMMKRSKGGAPAK
jgi:uncharacterized membrane protein YeaQ/YmgE (transglycosylase-associated protein family)